jgi:MSHA pilin protein MshC
LKPQQGFTLIELIMVILMLGVLAVFVVPKMGGPSAFNARGFHDETLAYLRYAQKTAVAQRRTVCVAFPDASTVRLSVASAANSWTCDAALIGPRGESPAQATAKSGVNFLNGAAPDGFRFDSLGQPVNASGAPLVIPAMQVDGATGLINVEPVTGYVHD